MPRPKKKVTVRVLYPSGAVSVGVPVDAEMAELDRDKAEWLVECGWAELVEESEDE